MLFHVKRHAPRRRRSIVARGDTLREPCYRVTVLPEIEPNKLLKCESVNHAPVYTIPWLS